MDGSHLASLHHSRQFRLANAEKAAGFADAYQQRYCAEFEGFGYVFRYGLMRWGLVETRFLMGIMLE